MTKKVITDFSLVGKHIAGWLSRPCLPIEDNKNMMSCNKLLMVISNNFYELKLFLDRNKHHVNLSDVLAAQLNEIFLTNGRRAVRWMFGDFSSKRKTLTGEQIFKMEKHSKIHQSPDKDCFEKSLTSFDSQISNFQVWLTGWQCVTFFTTLLKTLSSWFLSLLIFLPCLLMSRTCSQFILNLNIMAKDIWSNLFAKGCKKGFVMPAINGNALCARSNECNYVNGAGTSKNAKRVKNRNRSQT